MFKKLNLKILVIVFVALLAIVIIINLTENKKGERSFKSELINFNIEDASSLVIMPKSGEEDVILKKKEEGWKVGNKEKFYNADDRWTMEWLCSVRGR